MHGRRHSCVRWQVVPSNVMPGSLLMPSITIGAYGREGGNAGLCQAASEQLDDVARPYVRKHAVDYEQPEQLDRPVAAEHLKNWWAAQVVSFDGAARGAKLTKAVSSMARTFRATIRDGRYREFASLRTHLPTGWDSNTSEALVAIAVGDVFERDVVKETRTRSELHALADDLGEKLTRFSLSALGYENKKVKELFAYVNKRAKKRGSSE
jgi:hypothetical protein